MTATSTRRSSASESPPSRWRSAPCSSSPPGGPATGWPPRPAGGGPILAGAGVAIWLAAQAAAALSGWLGRFDLRPPPMVIWFASMIVMTLALAWSAFGRRFADKLPFVALIGFQAFRLPLELVMHRAAVAGIMPNVMSFTGYNFDIVTGATALPLASLRLAPPPAPPADRCSGT